MAKGKKSDREAKQELEQRLQEIEFLRQRAQQQGLAFSAPSKEQLDRKIRGETSNSPYILSLGWTRGLTPGSSPSVNPDVANPDPYDYEPMFVSVFFGAGNFLNNMADEVIGRDNRWPYLSTPPFKLASGTTSSQVLLYTTPSTVEPSTYLGNAVLWRGPSFGKATYCDRAMFYVTVT